MPEETGVPRTSGLGTEGVQKSPRLSINQLKVQVEEILFRNGWFFCHSGSFSLECSCCNRRQPLYLVVCLELLFQNQTPTEGQLARAAWTTSERMSDDYPFTWAPISPEDDATVKRCYGELGKCRDLVRFFFQGKLSIFMMLKSLSWMRRHFSCSTSLSNRMPYT